MPDIRRNPDAPILRFDHYDSLVGGLWKSEGARLAHLAAQVPADQAVVDIGAAGGKTTVFLASGAKAGERPPVHAIDDWDTDGLELFETQVRGARVWSQVTAHPASEPWDGPPVGLLVIADATLDTLTAWLPHVAPGGTVAFTGYTETKQVTRVVNAWVARDRLRPVRYKRVVSVEVPA